MSVNKIFLIILISTLILVGMFACEVGEFQTVPDLSFAFLFVNDLEGEYVNINGIRMYYEIHGQGEPLLLLHSGFAFIESFYKQIPAFSKYFRVIAPDRRGHGRTSDSNQPLDYSLLASDMAKLLEYLNIESAFVVGWGDGGNIGIQMALDSPQLVKKLVMIGSNYSPDGLTEEIIEYAKSSGTNDLDKEAFKWYKRLSPNPERWPDFQKKVKNMWLTLPDLTTEDLKKIQAPSMVIVGENDVVRIDHAKSMQNAIPNADLHVIRGASHFVPVEKPKILNNLVITFLKTAQT